MKSSIKSLKQSENMTTKETGIQIGCGIRNTEETSIDIIDSMYGAHWNTDNQNDTEPCNNWE